MEVKEVKCFEIPTEIWEFYTEVFELYQIRALVDEHKGIKFIIHTNDHNPPHIHAKYDNYEIAISLIDFKVLAGNIPERNKNIAIKHIKEKKDYFLNYWNDKTLVSTLPLTKSMLDSKETVRL